jgi:hypothetical protein
MLQRVVRRLGVFTCLAAAGASGWNGFAAEPASAPVWQRVTAEGEAYHAVLLKPARSTKAVAPRVHAVVVDTSASQVGEHRQHALAVVDSLLSQLPADHTVRLFALDMIAEPLATEFAAPHSATAKASLAALKQRLPLGATDLIGGLQAVLKSLPADQPASVVFIGDGQSNAKLAEAAKFKTLVDQFRARQVSISSYAVGPQVNLQILGCLAVQTGGNVSLDSRQDRTTQKPELTDAERAKNDELKKLYNTQAAQKLAQAATGRVLYPSQLTVTPQTVALLPATPLPLREDRETIYLVPGVLPADVQVQLSAQGEQQTWNLSDAVEGQGVAFLPAYTQMVQRDAGLSNGLAGASLLAVANDEFQSTLLGLLNQGQQALQAQQADRAARIGEQVRQLDGGLVEAKRLVAAAEQLQAKLVSRQVEPAPPAAGIGADETATNPNLIDEVERNARVREQKLSQQVSSTIEAARSTTEPAVAIDELKRVLTSIRSALDISPDVRSKLIKQLEGELLATTTRGQSLAQKRLRANELLAQKEAQARLAEQASLDEERLANLIDRVRALMEAGRHGDDAAYGEAQAVADVAINLRPGEGTSAAARFDSEAAEQLNRAYRLRARRADQFLETLHQVELSHIPFPDEPPIRFPPAEVWKALTERRKVWQSVDLRKSSAIERRIEAALNERTNLSFTDTALSEAIAYLEDLHSIEIFIDEVALTEAGVDISKPITLDLGGITLRSALRLLLEREQLTYLIQDEVMKITTIDEADLALSTRVYPVADLVIPITNLGGGGGFGGGGLGGGQQGGFGGGGLGGGGFGGQGGGGFGGGGFGAVAPEAVPAKKN